MKIVCDACQAKYSISDDKVQGKVFKIRCKKCSNIIVVRGGAEAAAAAAPAPQEKDTRVYDYGYEGGEQAPAGDESVWHVVINQDQVGPMTANEVRQRFAASEIDGETYGWREGFADWLPLAQIDAFADLVASGSTTAAVAPKGSGADAVSAMFGGGGGDESGTMRSDPGDLFAAASGGGRAQAAASSHDDDGDLFGSKPSGGASSKDSGANSKLRGERNENSVLFSLNNLAQLASDKPAPVMSAPSGGHATGAAGGEGSGLIDIRSMASAYLGGGAGAAKSGTGASSSIGSIDDLPVFGGGGFSEPAVIVPTSRSQSNNKFMLALIGGVGVLAIAAIILVVVMMKGNNNKTDQVAVNDKPVAGGVGSDDTKPAGGGDTTKPATPDTAKPATPDTGKPATPDTTKPATPDTTKPATPDNAATPPSTPDKKPVAPPTPHNKPATPAGQVTAPPAHKDPAVVAHKDPTPPPATPEKKPPAGDAGGCDEVSCVLNNYEGACCAKFKKGGGAKKPPAGGGDPVATSKPASDLPDALDRSMISSGVDKVKARVMSCGDKSQAKGQVKVSVKVTGDGHVASVTVKSSPDPALGTCVQNAMQKATFAKTQNGGSFGYPFVF